MYCGRCGVTAGGWRKGVAEKEQRAAVGTN